MSRSSRSSIYFLSLFCVLIKIIKVFATHPERRQKVCHKDLNNVRPLPMWSTHVGLADQCRCHACRRHGWSTFLIIFFNFHDVMVSHIAVIGAIATRTCMMSWKVNIIFKIKRLNNVTSCMASWKPHAIAASSCVPNDYPVRQHKPFLTMSFISIPSSTSKDPWYF